MTRPRIVVVGSINIDLVTRAKTLPLPGQTLQGHDFSIVLGGKGANQAIAAARLGADVSLIACVGSDSFGTFALAELAREQGLDLAHVMALADVSTGIASIAIDSSGQNAITIVPGANGGVTPALLAAKSACFAGCDVLLLQGEVPMAANIAAAQLARAAGGHVILDPAPVPQGGFPADLLALADFVTPNETEAQALTGISVDNAASARRAADALVAKGAANIVIKMGAKGAFALDSAGETHQVAPFSVNVVDTVAAGDSFNAGLAVGLGRRIGLADALRLASACGALATTRPGASTAAPTTQEVQSLLG